jgi:hypothetical protein
MGQRDHTMLYKCNFEEWLFELQLLCVSFLEKFWLRFWPPSPSTIHRRFLGELTNPKIETFKYNLEKFYSRFDKTTRYLEILGVKMKNDHVVRVFANGCYGHWDLKTRAELVHLEIHDNNHELKFYSTIMDSQRSGDRIKREFTAKVKYHKNFLRCSNCHRRGDTVEMYWKKHPEVSNKHRMIPRLIRTR